MPIMHLGAAKRGRPAVHLALPLGLVGFAGSWFVCDFFRFGFTGAEESSPSIAVGSAWTLVVSEGE